MPIEARDFSAADVQKEIIKPKAVPLADVLGNPLTLWKVPTLVRFGGSEFEIEVLSRIPLKDTPEHKVVATWVTDYEPEIGLPIKNGWSNGGKETVALADVYKSPNSPSGWSVVLERSYQRISKRLAEAGIFVERMPSGSAEEAAYYSSANFNRPHLYPGGTRNGYRSIQPIISYIQQIVPEAA
jgi:hypothetical protein